MILSTYTHLFIHKVISIDTNANLLAYYMYMTYMCMNRNSAHVHTFRYAYIAMCMYLQSDI